MKPSKAEAYQENQAGLPTAPEISDSLQEAHAYPYLPVDPASLLSPFVTPGMPVAVNSKDGLRGRSEDQGTIQRGYVSKGVLPL